MFTIQLNELRFYAYHGIHAEERRAGGYFTVSVSVDYQETTHVHTIESTIDYTVLYDLVKSCMLKPTELLENIAEQICKGITLQYPQVCGIQITISKLRAPIPGVDGSTSVRLQRSFS